MGEPNEITAAQADQSHVSASNDDGAEGELIASGSIRLGADDAPAAQAALAGGSASTSVSAALEGIEHPLTIIAEIEQLLRIVGNVAVHEYRRIMDRLADLKNHPAIKPSE